MKPEWEVKSLGEVLKLHYGKPLPKADRKSNAPVPVYGANGIKAFSDKSYGRGPSLIVGRKGSAGEINLANGPFWPLDVTYYTEHDETKIDFAFLRYLLTKLDLPSLAKGVKPGINRNDVYALDILLPPLEEQRRIVAVLDEAFEGLDRARKNTEANLANARELFESYLDVVLHQNHEDWSTKSLVELGLVQTGSTPKTSDPDNKGTYIPFIKPGDFRPDGSLDYFNQGLSAKGASASRLVPSGSALMVCIGATIGKAAFADQNITTNQQINSITPREHFSGEYLYFYMLTEAFQEQVIINSGQATLPIINKGKWSNIQVRIPDSVSTQEAIVKKLKQVQKEAIDLVALYNAQFTSLDDLRQSILQRAFAGELTASTVHPVATPANDNTSPEFAACILAYAYNAHAAEERQNTFGHVKAQKTLHLVEAVAGIDMGRDPIKDRAGPNDTAHMQRAEDWAEEQELFRFQRERGREGYTFLRMKYFNAGLRRAEEQLDSIAPVLEHVLGILVTMDSREAEAVATTYTAWNNFLIEGLDPTDAQIARAASIDWHPDKKLTEAECLTALAILRREELIPDGSGKYVGIQGNLL